MKLAPSHPHKLKLSRLKRPPPLEDRPHDQIQIIHRERVFRIQIRAQRDLVRPFSALVFLLRHLYFLVCGLVYDVEIDIGDHHAVDSGGGDALERHGRAVVLHFDLVDFERVVVNDVGVWGQRLVAQSGA